MSRISFDYDHSLSRKDVQDFARQLISEGYDVWVTTQRASPSVAAHRFKNSHYNDDLFAVTDELGIDREKITFMNCEHKYFFIRNMDFLFHLDDDFVELVLINKYTPTVGISCWSTTSWRKKCRRVLNDYKYNGYKK